MCLTDSREGSRGVRGLQWRSVTFSWITSAVDGGFTTNSCACEPQPSPRGSRWWGRVGYSLPQPVSISCNYAHDLCSGTARSQQGLLGLPETCLSSSGGQSAVKMGHSWQQQKESEARSNFSLKSASKLQGVQINGHTY